MPVYDYQCSECDTEFTMLMQMSRSADPAICPECMHYAERIISAPRLSMMRADIRNAHQTNERSAHEPKMTQSHRCGAGCSHKNHGKSEQPALKQVSSAKRPWMLGH